MSVFGVTNLNTTYSIKLDEVSDTVFYVGEAAISASESAAVWRIKKIAISGTTLSVLWADGDQLFNNVWDDRLSLSYS